MTKLQITELNLDDYYLSLNQQVQVKGGEYNIALYDFLEAYKEILVAFSGKIGPNTVEFNFVANLGNNQVF